MTITRATIDEQLDAIMFGAELGDDALRTAMARELRKRLVDAEQQGRPLRVYAGYDPSSPDLHLGHTITLRKLRQFQDLGHEVTFLVGTFTARVGDTSDKTTGRPQKTAEEVLAAAQSYAAQCFRILDQERTKVVYNADWLAELTLAKVVEVASIFTVQQFLTRDNYRRRIEGGDPVGLHEFLYALLQGYDAVHLRCDVQIGATEQLFNIMAGRKMQEAYGQPPSICITYPILVGTDGTERMSKSKGNVVGIADPPEEQFGKIMSVSDATMLEWARYVTAWPPEQIRSFTRAVEAGELHPMLAKKQLASAVVALYHGPDAPRAAQDRFEQIHQRQELPEDMPSVELPHPRNIIDLLCELGAAPTKSQARRLIDGRGVRIDDDPVATYDYVLDRSAILKVGKRRFFKITLA